jgi:hypothetical protein
MRMHGIVVVFTSLSPSLESLLRNHGVIRDDADDEEEEEEDDRAGIEVQSYHYKERRKVPQPRPLSLCLTIPRLDDALEWCEDQILAVERSRLQPLHDKKQQDRRLPSSPETRSPTWPLRLILEDYLELDNATATATATATAATSTKEEDVGSTAYRYTSPQGSHKQAESATLLGGEEAHALLDTDVLGLYFRREEYPSGQVIFDVGDKANKVSERAR